MQSQPPCAKQSWPGVCSGEDGAEAKGSRTQAGLNRPRSSEGWGCELGAGRPDSSSMQLSPPPPVPLLKWLQAYGGGGGTECSGNERRGEETEGRTGRAGGRGLEMWGLLGEKRGSVHALNLWGPCLVLHQGRWGGHNLQAEAWGFSVLPSPGVPRVAQKVWGLSPRKGPRGGASKLLRMTQSLLLYFAKPCVHWS